MNRLSNNDRNWGPFTFSNWSNTISARLSSGDDEDPENYLLFTAFRRALRIKLPQILKVDEKYGEEKEYGFSLSAEDGAFSYLSVSYGLQSWDGNKTRRWGYFLPWTQWNFVRHSIYTPEGELFAEARGTHVKTEIEEQCPNCVFEIEDYDGEKITATCKIEEREWSKGEKLFSWLKYFKPNFVRRVLDIWFSSEVGKNKGSWKGGTIGTSIDMLPGENPESAFKRFCEKEHSSKSGKYKINFLK